jgi:hypothetical protein
VIEKMDAVYQSDRSKEKKRDELGNLQKWQFGISIEHPKKSQYYCKIEDKKQKSRIMEYFVRWIVLSLAWLLVTFYVGNKYYYIDSRHLLSLRILAGMGSIVGNLYYIFTVDSTNLYVALALTLLEGFALLFRLWRFGKLDVIYYALFLFSIELWFSDLEFLQSFEEEKTGSTQYLVWILVLESVVRTIRDLEVLIGKSVRGVNPGIVPFWIFDRWVDPLRIGVYAIHSLHHVVRAWPKWRACIVILVWGIILIEYRADSISSTSKALYCRLRFENKKVEQKKIRVIDSAFD